MSALETVIKLSKKAEHILESGFGAAGRGLHEKVSSVERKIPSGLVKKLRYVATIRNHLVHELDFELNNPEEFFITAKKAIEELEQLEVQLTKVSENSRLKATPKEVTSKPEKGSSFWRWVFIASLCYIGYQWVLGLKISKPQVAVQTEQQAIVADKLSGNSNEISAEERKAQARRKHGEALELDKPKPLSALARENVAEVKVVETKPLTKVSKDNKQLSDKSNTPSKNIASAWQQKLAKGQHVVVPSEILEITNVRFRLEQGSFSRIEPRIELTVKNTSNMLLSSARLDARLYISDRKLAVVDTENTRDKLFLSFGELGLKPGDSAQERIYISGFDSRDWTTPDILNAKKKQLVLKLNTLSDGMSNRILLSNQSFSQLGVQSGLKVVAREIKKIESVMPRLDELKKDFNNGKSIGIGNEVLLVEDVTLQYQKGSFGRQEAKITVKVRNQSSTILSSAYFHGQLFLDGKKTPVLTTGRKKLFAHFGKKGLAPGETVTDTLLISGFEERKWVKPTILNSTKRQVMLRLDSVSDGSKNRMNASSADYISIVQ